jgi:hypothetical protein
MLRIETSVAILLSVAGSSDAKPSAQPLWPALGWLCVMHTLFVGRRRVVRTPASLRQRFVETRFLVITRKLWTGGSLPPRNSSHHDWRAVLILNDVRWITARKSVGFRTERGFSRYAVH